MLIRNGHFNNVINTERYFDEDIIKEKYIGVWESVKDIKVK